MLMRECLGGHGRTRLRALVVAALAVAGSGAVAQGAGATVIIQNHSDPAGDPALFPYHLDLPNGPADFQLRDGEDKGFGSFMGTVVATAHPPAGWTVADIQCTGSEPAAFAIDVPHGRVTMQHNATDEQICSFTNRKAAPPNPRAPGAPAPPAPAPAPGVAPAPPGNIAPRVVQARKAAVLQVFARRRAAIARVNLVRRSVIKGQLFWRGRPVGVSRVVRQPGTYDLTVRLRRDALRQLRRGGRKRVTLTLAVVVAPRPRGAATVFRSGVIVRL
jgi:hypothetical protein